MVSFLFRVMVNLILTNLLWPQQIGRSVKVFGIKADLLDLLSARLSSHIAGIIDLLAVSKTLEVGHPAA